MASSRKKKRQPAITDRQYIKVSLLFCLIAILLNLFNWNLVKKEYWAFFDIFTAKAVTSLIQLSGLNATRVSNKIHLVNTVWVVAAECNAVFIMSIFSSFILVYPSSLKAKWISLAVGIPFIFGANITRLFIMAWIDKLKPQYLSFFHDYIWQVVFIIMVVLMWLIWIEKVVNREAKTAVRS